MTKGEFQVRYRRYRTMDRDAAKAEADKANAEGIDGGTAIAVDFGMKLGCGLMLQSAFEGLAKLGLPMHMA